MLSQFLSLFFSLVAATVCVCVCVPKRVLAESLSDKCKSNLSLRFAVSLCLVFYISQIMWKNFEPFFALLSLRFRFFPHNFLLPLFFVPSLFLILALAFRCPVSFLFYVIRHSLSRPGFFHCEHFFFFTLSRNYALSHPGFHGSF